LPAISRAVERSDTPVSANNETRFVRRVLELDELVGSRSSIPVPAKESVNLLICCAHGRTGIAIPARRVTHAQ
jgi:hypothetical protein